LDATRKIMKIERAFQATTSAYRRKNTHNCYLVPKEWKGLSTKLSVNGHIHEGKRRIIATEIPGSGKGGTSNFPRFVDRPSEALIETSPPLPQRMVFEGQASGVVVGGRWWTRPLTNTQTRQRGIPTCYW
jgi:hypothetical protein